MYIGMQLNIEKRKSTVSPFCEAKFQDVQERWFSWTALYRKCQQILQQFCENNPSSWLEDRHN